MKQMDRAQLQRIVDENHHYTKQGKVADYIPELGHADASALGLTVASREFGIISVGDCPTTFTLQSISKVISLMIASGGILVVVPNRMGIGVIGPAIDEKGNSVAGVRVLAAFSREYHLHLLA